MYRAFKLNGEEIKSRLEDEKIGFQNLVESGEKFFEKDKTEIKSTLPTLKGVKGVLDGAELSIEWFPQKKVDVFISHSHKDADVAKAIAYRLYKQHGITAFIDSCVWGYADDMLKIIDNEYCKNSDRKTYSYEKRNISTSHVHMMLTIALAKMMYNTEALFFLSTPNSNFKENGKKYEIPTDGNELTLSPWIYTEIGLEKLMEKLPKEYYRPKIIHFSESTENAEMFNLIVAHQIDTSDLEKIETETFINWLKETYEERPNSKKKYQALDGLYEMIDKDKENPKQYPYYLIEFDKSKEPWEQND